MYRNEGKGLLQANNSLCCMPNSFQLLILEVSQWPMGWFSNQLFHFLCLLILADFLNGKGLKSVRSLVVLLRTEHFDLVHNIEHFDI
jgi:hypothetical protein